MWAAGSSVICRRYENLETRYSPTSALLRKVNAEQEELKRDFSMGCGWFYGGEDTGLFCVKPPHHHYNFISDQS